MEIMGNLGYIEVEKETFKAKWPQSLRLSTF